MSQNILLISDTMIKERTAVHGNIDPKLIYPDIKLAQDMYLPRLIGSALFSKLQTIIADGTITSDGTLANYKTLVDHYIADTLIYYTLSELPTTISYQFWNKGVMRKQNDNSELPSMSELMDLANKYKQRAEFYANRLSLFVTQNATAMFPEFLSPGSGLDTIYPGHKPFTMPVYLGEEDDYCNQTPYKPYSE